MWWRHNSRVSRRTVSGAHSNPPAAQTKTEHQSTGEWRPRQRTQREVEKMGRRRSKTDKKRKSDGREWSRMQPQQKTAYRGKKRR